MQKDTLRERLRDAEAKNAELLRRCKILTAEKAAMWAELYIWRKEIPSQPDKWALVQEVCTAVVRLFGFDPEGIKKVPKAETVKMPEESVNRILGPDGGPIQN